MLVGIMDSCGWYSGRVPRQVGEEDLANARLRLLYGGCIPNPARICNSERDGVDQSCTGASVGGVGDPPQ